MVLFLLISREIGAGAACNDFVECTQRFYSLILRALGHRFIAGLPVSLSSKLHKSQSSQEARDIYIYIYMQSERPTACRGWAGDARPIRSRNQQH